MKVKLTMEEYWPVYEVTDVDEWVEFELEMTKEDYEEYVFAMQQFHDVQDKISKMLEAK